MNMKLLLSISVSLAALVLLTGVSCTRQELPGGAVTITLSSGRPETRGAAEIADGSEIYRDSGTGEPDLIVLLFNAEGNLTAKYPAVGQIVSNPTPSDLMVRMGSGTDGNRIASGDYTVYALANTANLTTDGWPLTGGTIAGITSQADADALLFNAALPASVTRMPLVAKGSLSVDAEGRGNATLNLQRPVARVTVRFVNQYGDELTLTPFSFTLRGVNPDRGYLFPHTPDIPAGITYGNISRNIASSSSAVLPDNTDPANPVYEISSLVYPGEGPYSCALSFSITKVGDNPVNPAREFVYDNLPVQNRRGEDIPSIARNQSLAVTITISKGRMLSFSFEVGGWTEKTETVTFD
jgi:hypothetical protein